MTQRLILDHTGTVVKSVHVEDPNSPDLVGTFQISQNCDPLLRDVAIARDQFDRKADYRLVAKVPMTVLHQSMIEGWDDKDWNRWLNDPENAAFRTGGGRI